MDNKTTIEVCEGSDAVADEANIGEQSIEEAPPVYNERKVRGRVRKLYNSASSTFLFQLGISTAISTVISTVYGIYAGIKIVIENPEADNIVELITDATTNPMLLLVTTIISYLIANIASYFIGNAMTNKHCRVKIFGKIQMKPIDCILSVVAIIGVQMISVLIQTLVVNLTGLNGIDQSTAGILSFSDNVLQNILLVLYTVVIAAITEELICRGVVMKAFSVKSRAFALFASSLLFGLMHGNFNQIFNGFLLGLVIGYAALKSKSIFMPIILHMCANGHAMIFSFLEYKLGEGVNTFMTIYSIVMAVLGIGAVILLIVRCGKPADTDGYPIVSTIEGLDVIENQKGLGLPTLFKSVAFWIVTVVYISSALFMMLMATLMSMGII